MDKVCEFSELNQQELNQILQFNDAEKFELLKLYNRCFSAFSTMFERDDFEKNMEYEREKIKEIKEIKEIRETEKIKETIN